MERSGEVVGRKEVSGLSIAAAPAVLRDRERDESAGEPQLPSVSG